MDATDGREDAELVAAVLAGDREAFGPLLARWQASMVRLCQRLLGPSPQAEDIAQEAAVQAFLGLPRLADPAGSAPGCTRSPPTRRGWRCAADADPPWTGLFATLA